MGNLLSSGRKREMRDEVNRGVLGQGGTGAGGQETLPPQPQAQPIPNSPVATSATDATSATQAKTPSSDILSRVGASQSGVDASMKHTEDILHGRDFATQQLQNRIMEQNASTQAALRGAQAQRGMLSGISGATAEVLSQMQERQIASQEAQTMGGLSQVLGQRADSAASQLYNMSTNERGFQMSKATQAMSDMLSASDMTKPENIEKFSKMYEGIYGTKPSMEQIINNQWDAKSNRAAKQLNIFATENNLGDGDYSKVSNNPEWQRILKEKWEADTQGLGLEMPEGYGEEQWRKSTITAEEKEFGRIMSGITNSDMFKGLTEAQQQSMMTDLEALGRAMTLGINVGIDKNGKIVIKDAMSDVDLSKSSNYFIGDKVVDWDADGTMATIDGAEFDYDEETGEWYNEDGASIGEDHPMFGTLSEFLKKSGATKKEPVKINVSTATANDIFKAIQSGNIEKNKAEIRQWLQTKGNELTPDMAKGLVGKGVLKEADGQMKHSGSGNKSDSRKRIPFLDTASESGEWIEINGKAAKISSSNQWAKDKAFSAKYWIDYTVTYEDGTTEKISADN